MTTEERTFHGPVAPRDLGAALIAEFNQGDMRAQAIGDDNNLVVQVASTPFPSSGGRTAIAVHLTRVEDGVHAQLGSQQWLGVAASMGITVLAALRNPFTLLGRLDDLAQDIASVQLTDRIWQTLERTAHSMGAAFEISEKLRRLTCDYCRTANPVGEPHCIACGAPLGPEQPLACPNCGFVVRAGTSICPNCQNPLPG